MAASFAGINAYLVNAAAPVPSGVYPLMVGMWVRPASLGVTRRFWSLSDPASDNNFLYVGQSSGDVWVAASTDPTNVNGPSAGTVSTGAWAFLCARFISTTLRCLDVLQADGSIAAGTNTNNRSPSGMTQMGLGARVSATPSNFFNGLIGEFWWGVPPAFMQANAALDGSLLRQLAYGGPFLIPSVGAGIIEYRSLRTHPTAGGRRGVYVGRGAPAQVWSAVNSVTIGQHPPLPPYRNERRVVRTF